MSRFFVLVKPPLAPGFRLAGVETYEASEAEEAEQYLRRWLDSKERGLVAIDDGFIENIDQELMDRLNASDRLLNIIIPGGNPLETAADRQERLTRMVRRAVGVQVAFGDSEAAGANNE